MQPKRILDGFAREVTADAAWAFWSTDPQGAMHYFHLPPHVSLSFYYDWLQHPDEGSYVDWALLRLLMQPFTAYGRDSAFGLTFDSFSGDAFLQVRGTCPGQAAPFADLYGAFCGPICPAAEHLDVCIEADGSLTDVVLDLLAWQAECPNLDVEIRALYPHLDNALISTAHLSPAGLAVNFEPINNRYALYYRAAQALAGTNADALYDYILHGMDDDGDFLRTRHQRWDTALPDTRLHTPPVLVMATLETPFDFARDTKYYSKNGRPRLRMQLFFLSEGQSFLDGAALATEGEYPHIRIRSL